MISKNHNYFLLQPSPWPLMLSILSFNLLLSLLIFFKTGSLVGIILSVLVLSLSSFLWWGGFKKEFNFLGFNTFSMEIGVKTSMILFISSEVFFFFSFFWGYFHFFLSPPLEVGLSWPPVSVESFNPLYVPFLNTLILLSSGVLVTLSHYFLNLGKKKFFNFYLGSTVLLGLIFSFFQFQEYKSSFFSISDGSFGSSFFMLTGFHGLHVIIGSLFLLSVLMLSKFSNPAQMSFLSFELSCWYWHFVDVVWIFLFFFLYYLN